jgi:hypothetical protein
MALKNHIPLAIAIIRFFNIILNLAGLGLAITISVLPPDFDRQSNSDEGGMQHPTLSYALIAPFSP